MAELIFNPCNVCVRQRCEICVFHDLAVRSIEAEPVKHSRWKYNGCFLCECQNCGEIYSRYANDGKDWNYCPNCGAKMDLEE